MCAIASFAHIIEPIDFDLFHFEYTQIQNSKIHNAKQTQLNLTKFILDFVSVPVSITKFKKINWE